MPAVQATKHRKSARPSSHFGHWLAIVLLTLFGSLLACWGLSFGEIPTEVQSTHASPASRYKYETRAIEDLREGDLVLARDEHGRELGLKQVVATYVRTSDHLRILTFESEDGTRQTLKTTDEHPFWSVGESEFVEASDLAVGTQVIGPHGELQHLIATVYEPHPEGFPVYNFQVENFHTYFVNENGARAPPALVHNADYATGGADFDANLRRWRDSSTGRFLKKPVVVGETMDRVREAARQLNADIYDPKVWHRDVDNYMDSLKKNLLNNSDWLSDAIDQGTPIIDIGIDPNRATPSIYYFMESEILNERADDVLRIFPD